jgi:WD40 repeat protein
LRNSATGQIQQTLREPNQDLKTSEFSPNGRNFGVVSGNIARIWDISSGRLRTSLLGHELDIKSMEFSPDNNLVVTASIDNTARIWNLNSGRVVQILRGHSASVLWAGFSPDGKKVLTTGNDHTARIWAVETGRELLHLNAERALARGRFSPDGQRILIFGGPIFGREYLGLYSTEGQELAIWRKGAVVAADFAPDGKTVRMVTSEDGKSLEIRALPGGNVLHTLGGDSELLGVVQFSADKKHLLSTGFDRSPKVWNVSTGALENVLNISPGKDPISRAVSWAEFSPDSQRVLLLTGDGEITAWNLTLEHQILEGHAPGLFYLSFSSNGKFLLSADRKALIVRTSDGTPIQSIEPQGGILHIFIDPYRSRILTASPDTTAQLWSIPDGHLVASIKGNSKDITSADFSSDGRTIVTAEHDGVVNFWDSVTGQKVRSFPRHGAELWSVQFSPDGKRILLTSREGSVEVWDTVTAQRACLLMPPVTGSIQHISARYSPDGRVIVTGGKRPKVWRSNCEVAAELPQHVDASISSFSPDSLHFVTVGLGESIRVWSANDGKLQATLQRNTLLPGSTSFSPDSKWLLVAGTEKTSLWSAETGLFISAFGDNAQVGPAAFNPTGTAIATASADGTLEIWKLRLETRSSDEIDRLIDSYSHWKLKNGVLSETKKWSPSSMRH